MDKMVYVHLILKKKDYFFGSIAAIYDHLDAQRVGASYNTLRNVRWKDTSVHTPPGPSSGSEDFSVPVGAEEKTYHNTAAMGKSGKACEL